MNGDEASKYRSNLHANTNFDKGRNSYNSTVYRDTYRSHLNNNYGGSGFFSNNSSMNSIFWGYIIGDMIGDGFRDHAYQEKFNKLDEKQKELMANIRDGHIPLYMLEIKLKDGSTKQITVTKEMYERVRKGDEIEIKNGQLTIKSGEGKKLEDEKKSKENKEAEEKTKQQ